MFYFFVKVTDFLEMESDENHISLNIVKTKMLGFETKKALQP